MEFDVTSVIEPPGIVEAKGARICQRSDRHLRPDGITAGDTDATATVWVDLVVPQEVRASAVIHSAVAEKFLNSHIVLRPRFGLETGTLVDCSAIIADRQPRPAIKQPWLARSQPRK